MAKADDLMDEDFLEDDLDDSQSGIQEDDLDNVDDDFLDDGFDGDAFGGGPSPMEKHNDLLKQLTNFSPYLKAKINGWLGLIWNDEKEKYIEDPSVKPIMNTQCAKWCVGYLETYARENNIITHINKDDYKDLHEDIIEVVWENLGTRPEEFDIYSEGDLKTICVELEHAAILVLMGAGDGKYGGLLKETINRNESVNYTNPYDRMNGQMQGLQKQKSDGFFIRMGKALKGGF